MKFLRFALALILLVAGCSTQQPAKVTTLPPVPIATPPDPLAAIMPRGFVPSVIVPPEQPTPATMIMRGFAQPAVVIQPGTPGFVFLPCKLGLQWNPSVPNLEQTNIATHYNLYYGDCHFRYTTLVPLGNVTNATLLDLIAWHRYFFTVTALDDFGGESDYAPELEWVVAPQEAELRLDPPGDALLSSADLFSWGSRDGTLSNGVWRIKVRTNSTEFYRSLIFPAQTNLP